jgi:hypothetical protein
LEVWSVSNALTASRLNSAESIMDGTTMTSVAIAPSAQIDPQLEAVQETVLRFVAWLDRYGETSYDYQSYFSGKLARSAKALYYRRPLIGMVAVSPMVLSEAFFPSGRCLFWKRQRFPIADAHYAMGFAMLSHLLNDDRYYQRAVHFLQVLEETRCERYRNYCWGYPFPWETRFGTIAAGTPLITTTPYVYEAFLQVYQLDGNAKWLDIMRSIAEHVFSDYFEEATSERASSCSYHPEPKGACLVVNASAYRAFLLTRAAHDLSEPRYWKVAERNLNYVLESQNADGSWRYATDGGRDFVDHYHTCFVLKALAKIESLTGNKSCTEAIERGVAYYLKNLFDQEGVPIPFARRPRMTIYKRELYDFAECVNLGVLLRGRFPALDTVVSQLMPFRTWQKSDGSFRSRKLLIGWDNTPMHRWAQAQMFRSLCFLLYENRKSSAGKLTLG